MAFDQAKLKLIFCSHRRALPIFVVKDCVLNNRGTLGKRGCLARGNIRKRVPNGGTDHGNNFVCGMY